MVRFERLAGKVLVVADSKEGMLKIRVQLSDEQCFVFQRKSEDLLEQTLKRMAGKIGQPVRLELSNGCDALQAGAVAAPSTATASDLVPKEGITSGQAFVADSTLCVGESSRLPICFDVPTVLALEVAQYPMVGSPIIPLVQLTNAVVEACQWQWLRCAPGQSLAQGEVVASSMAYTPKPQDLDHMLVCVCTPGDALGNVGQAVACTNPPTSKKDEEQDAARQEKILQQKQQEKEEEREVTAGSAAGQDDTTSGNASGAATGSAVSASTSTSTSASAIGSGSSSFTTNSGHGNGNAGHDQAQGSGLSLETGSGCQTPEQQRRKQQKKQHSAGSEPAVAATAGKAAIKKQNKKQQEDKAKGLEVRHTTVLLADEQPDVVLCGETVKEFPQRVYNSFLRKTLQERGPQPSSTFRLAIYNILLDAFCDSNWALEFLYPYVRSRKYVRRDYRQQLVLDDVRALDADILCLQEVQGPVFTRYLDPHLQTIGYTCLYQNKKSVQPFGSCICFRTEKFELVKSELVDLTHAWQKLPHADDLVKAAPQLPEGLVRSTTIAHFVHLRARTPGQTSQQGEGEPQPAPSPAEIVVVNNHLYSSPNGANVRLMQAASMLQHAEENYPNLPLLVCGDFNTKRDSGVMQLMLQGRVSHSHPEWAEGDQFDAHRTDKQEEREFDWHSVLVWDDIALCRHTFCELDPQRTGMIECDLVRKHIPATLQQNSTAQTFEGRVSYRLLFRLFQDLKLENREQFHVFCESLKQDLSPYSDAEDAKEPMPTIITPQGYANCDLQHSLQLSLCHKKLECSYYAFPEPSPTVNDFILYTHQTLKNVYEVPPPSMEMNQLETALPSSQHPSDHVPLAADFTFCGENNNC